MNFVFETQTVTFTEGESKKTVSFTGPHSNIPTVIVSLLNSDNANFNAFTIGTTLTGTQVRLSANAPSGLYAKVHAISRT